MDDNVENSYSVNFAIMEKIQVKISLNFIYLR